MRPNQQNSFYKEEGHARYQNPYKAHNGMSPSGRQLELPGAVILWILRKAALLIERLIVIAKYQFYKNTAVAPSTIHLPILKVGIVGVLAFLVFKRDLSFTLGMGAQRAQFGTAAAEEVALRENTSKADDSGAWGGIAALFEKKDYFADEPSDNDEAKRVKAYIRRYKDVVMTEKEKFGIPASIKMAQAIVESNAGASPLSRKNNNHFGIKCFSRTCKKGHCSNFGDDSHKDFFRKYGNSWESFRAHSKLIVGGKYKTLLKHGDDYRKWAHGLKKLGYATASHYEETLIEMIEKYHLDELDK
jgi:hypothetical protein